MTSARKRATTKGLREQLLQDPLVRDLICRRAYEIYQDRGEEHGHDREDWLQAESEILYELIGQELIVNYQVELTELPAVQVPQGIPDYKRPPANAAASGPLLDRPIPEIAKLAPAYPFTKSSGKKPEKTKSTSHGKHKRAAEPKDGEASLIARAERKGGKSKSGHKSKAGKKKQKKT